MTRVQLPFTLRIFVPSTTGSGQRVPGLQQEATDKIADKLSRTCGGCTVTKGRGYWIGDANTMVIEDVNIVEAFSMSQIDDGFVDDLVQDMDPLEQEAIALVVNGIPEIRRPNT